MNKVDAGVRHQSYPHVIPIAGSCSKASLHERWQRKRIPPVLDTKHAQQEAVHEEEKTTKSDDSDLLSLGISDSRNLDG
jgi:hypothetical protein